VPRYCAASAAGWAFSAAADSAAAKPPVSAGPMVPPAPGYVRPMIDAALLRCAAISTMSDVIADALGAYLGRERMETQGTGRTFSNNRNVRGKASEQDR